MKITGKKVGVWLLTVILLLAFTACGAQDGATKAFETMMQALKSGEKEQVQVYFDMDVAMEKLLTERKAELEATVLETLKQMDYKIIASQKQDNSKVSLEVKLTTLDFTEVINRFVNQVMLMVSGEEYRSNIGNMSKEAYQNLLAEQMIAVLGQEDIPDMEDTVQVTMVKEDGNWKMQNGEAEFLDTIFANLTKAVNSLV